MSDKLDMRETTELSEMINERNGAVAGQVSALRSQFREMQREARDNREEDRELRKRVSGLEQVAASVKPEVSAAINSGMRQPLERVEEGMRKDLELLRDRMEMADKELRGLIDGLNESRASKSDLKTLTARLWGLAAMVIAAVFAGLYEAVGK